MDLCKNQLTTVQSVAIAPRLIRPHNRRLIAQEQPAELAIRLKVPCFYLSLGLTFSALIRFCTGQKLISRLNTRTGTCLEESPCPAATTSKRLAHPWWITGVEVEEEGASGNQLRRSHRRGRGRPVRIRLTQPPLTTLAQRDWTRPLVCTRRATEPPCVSAEITEIPPNSCRPPSFRPSPRFAVVFFCCHRHFDLFVRSSDQPTQLRPATRARPPSFGFLSSASVFASSV